MDGRKAAWLRLAGLMTMVALLALAWRSGALRSLDWSSLAAHESAWAHWAERHRTYAPLAFIALYAVAVTLSLPIGLWLGLISGLLFGTVPGGIFTAIGANLGAMAVFLVARGLLAPLLRPRLQKKIDWLRPGLERDGVYYLLALRLMPVFPFWLVNLAPAVVGMRLGPYALATVLGMIPTAFVLSTVGAGLRATLGSRAAPDPAQLLSPDILLPLLALAVLSLVPALWRQWQTRTTTSTPDQA